MTTWLQNLKNLEEVDQNELLQEIEVKEAIILPQLPVEVKVV